MRDTTERNGLEIAIIGMSGRFPGANNIHEFWENLKNGVNSIRFFTETELLEKNSVDPELIRNPNYVRAKGIIEDVEYFDAFFFGYSPMEAELLDPQIRIFYEVCWEALEDAGCDPSTYPGSIGVYAGGSPNRSWELLTIISGKQDILGQVTTDTMCDKDFLSTRISHKLDLRGPSVSIHTACSTALVGLDLACRGLLTGQCDAALVGGVSALSETAKGGGYLYEEGLIRSPDGYVRAFDAKAKGVVFSHGAGAVLLKRLDDAAADGDDIYAVIKGFSANNDGMVKSSFSAPAVDGQAQAIRAALYMAEVEPESITYVEAHGTGTAIGDPIEIEALRTAFDTDKRHYCAVGSLKTNIGHLDVAAGVAGLIKVALMMKHRQIPPSLNFEKPNPKIDFENSPFFVNTELREWENNGCPLRAGVSSFGVGGTNVHVVLEAWSMEHGAWSEEGREYQLVLLSARTPPALDKMTENLANYFKKNPVLPDAAYTLKVGRKAFEHRKMVVCRDVEEAAALLEAAETQTHYAKEQKRAVFMFPGQGSQYVDMARGLYETEPVFHKEMDRCFEILTPLMGYDVKEILYPSFNRSYRSYRTNINQTEITQPVIFVIEYALARLLMGWGIEPYAMIGHSIGEYTAACLSGVFSLEDALNVVVRRGKLMQQMPGGGMLSVPLGEEVMEPLLPETVTLAAVNGPSRCVVSGPYQDIETFASQLAAEGYQSRKLHTSHAFHSQMMDPILKTFQEKVAEVRRNTPTIPFISNVTGHWITPPDAKDPGYWARQLRSTVRFTNGTEELLKEKNAVFIEVGPGHTLGTLIKQHPDKKTEHMTVNLVRHPKEEVSDQYYLLTKLGQIWLYGASVAWNGFYAGEKRRRLHLPTYPFQRQRYWIEGNPIKMMKEGKSLPSLPGKKKSMNDWFYIPSWKRSVSHGIPGGKSNKTNGSQKWLVFAGKGGLSARLVKKLVKEYGNNVTLVRQGDQLAELEKDIYSIDPRRENDYETLIAQRGIPHRILHLWNLNTNESENCLDPGFYSLLHLARALAGAPGQENEGGREIEITVLTDGIQEVLDEGVLYPGKAVVLGPVMIIPREFPNIKCRCIDIRLKGPGKCREEFFIELLLDEFHTRINDAEPLIAFRGTHRLVRTFEPAPLPQPQFPLKRLRKGGVYLITGGTGGIGLVLARYLAKTVQARLILTGRSPFPAREAWDGWLNGRSNTDSTAQKIRKVKELEALGAEVLVYSVDVTDEQGMRQVVEEAIKRFGTVHGVIHSAGVPGGGVIQLKTREMADKVLAPKVKGTLALNSALKGITLDFFILCSSINTVLPLFGQVDYCAANAFLDAFAVYKNRFENTYTVSINWDAWQEVGMAADAAGTRAEKTTHPLLEQYTLQPDGREVYTSIFGFDRHWVLNEHVTGENNKGLVVGVTYMEMARAAFEKHVGNGMVEIRDVRFINPLLMGEGEEREVRMSLEKKEEHYEFLVSSRGTDGDETWQDHASGEITSAPVQQKESQKHDLEKLERECHQEEKQMPRIQEGLIIFGPRWQNVKELKFGKNQGLAVIELPGAFNADLEQYKLHPAMMDSAVAFLVGHLYKNHPYLPYFYKRVKIKRALTPRILSFSRLVEDGEASEGFVKFNVTLMDEAGNELVEVEEFTMLEISEGVLGRLKEKEHGAGRRELVKDEAPGILPSEGAVVFTRVLGSKFPLPQVVVSCTDLAARLEAARTFQMEKALDQAAAPAHARPGIGAAYVPPAGETQQKLARIWQQILGIDRVGANDDFFELGGDSLKAAVVISRVKKEFGGAVSMKQMFNAPTVKDLSNYLETSETIGYDSVEPAEKREYYPAAPMQKRFYIVNEMESTHTAFNLPFIMEIKGKVDRKKFEQALQLLINRHESLRTSFAMKGNHVVQMIHDHVDFHIHCLEAKEDEIEQIIREFVRPFDLSQVPLLRAEIVRLSEEKHFLLFDIHHITADGTAVVVLVRDFITFYQGRQMPALKLQYKDFCQWQESREGRGAKARQETYWLDQFKGQIPRLKLFTDYPRPPVQSFDGDSIEFLFDKELLQKLNGLMKETNTTLYMLLLAAYNILLAKHSGQQDIIVGSPAAAREHADSENLIGLFLNTLPMRNYPAPYKTFAEFLQEVKENTLKAYENQGYPYAQLIEKLDLVQDASRGPLFDAELLVQNVGLKPVEIQGLTFTPYHYESKIAQHDISLQIIELEQGLHFLIEYCTKLFKKETIEGFRDFFKKIILTVIENKEIKLADIKVEHHLKEVSSTAVHSDDIQFGF